MFKRWKPKGQTLGRTAGIALHLDGREVRVVWEEWINGRCDFKMRVEFGQSLAGLMVWDESPVDYAPGHLPSSEFDRSEAGCYSAWLERESSVLQTNYGDYARLKYQRIDRYYLCGQDTIVLLDIADSEPELVIEVPRSDSVDF